MNVEAVLVERKANAREDDYEKGGLLYCGSCHEPKQQRITVMGVERTVYCMCRCEAEVYQKAEEERQARERMESIQRMRSMAIQFPGYRKWTFAADDSKNPEKMSMAKRYVAKWRDMYRENCGLLLWGDVGTGKTFFAACIANALTDQMQPALMTNFTRISEAMGFDGSSEYMTELRRYKLLVIDDLGAERQSDYMLERVYGIVDARYKDRQPVIITTNLSLREIKEPKDLKYKRIYDRILEMCIPVRFSGESRRKEKHEEKKDLIRKLLESEGGNNHEKIEITG